MVVPEGFTLPPWPYLVAVLVALAASAAFLWSRRPPVTDRVVLAVVPWMAAGAAAHVLYVVGSAPSPVEPLFGVPTVYLTTAALAGVTWSLGTVAARRGGPDAPVSLAGVGVLVTVILVVAALAWGADTGSLTAPWPTVGLLVAAAVTAVVWVALVHVATETAEAARWTGVVVIFGHALDGITTAIGLDVLDGVERSPLADAIVSIGSRLPTAAYVGDAWLFVLVKVLLPVAVLVLFREWLEEEPARARAVLAVVAAVGLGPGLHNLLLFALSA